MSDLFHEKVPFEFIDKVFAMVALCPEHTFQVLTKRPERMLEYIQNHNDSFRDLDIPIMHTLETDYMHESWMIFGGQIESYCDYIGVSPELASSEMRLYDIEKPPTFPLNNLWLGVTVCNQKEADEKIPILLQIPAAVRFISIEPMLEGISLTSIQADRFTRLNVLEGCGVNKMSWCQSIPNVNCEKLDWVIVGCESGPNRRPCKNEWIYSIIDQCKAANVPCFVKQVDKYGKVVKGENLPQIFYPQEYPND
jgi:protein gp37